MRGDAPHIAPDPPAGDAPGDIVDVAVALPVFTPFTYRVPSHLRPVVSPGLRVLVPFGRRRVTGYVLGRAERLPGAR
jgi:primosomal protein N' (replication factor Y)